MRPFVDKAYFIASPLQANACARLRQAATFPGGVALLSGGPGVGKSAFVRQALVSVDSDVQLLPVDLRGMESAELAEAILHGLGAGAPSGLPTPARLREALLAQRTSGRQLILSLDVSGINVDLARRLLRLLYLSDEQQTPVSIILQGPHSLHQLLDVAGLIQLRQRLSFRLKMRPLTLLETAGYVRHCIAEGGANPDEVLAVNAPASVYLFVAGVPRLINTLMDAALGEVRARQQRLIDAELIRQVAEQLGWKPLGSQGGSQGGSQSDAAPVAKAAAAPAVRARERSATPPSARTEPPAPLPDAAVLPASEMTQRLQASRGRPATAAAPAATTAAARVPAAGVQPVAPAGKPPVPMDEVDTGATGMLRLEDLDERFAESLFSEDSGHFKVLIDAGKPD